MSYLNLLMGGAAAVVPPESPMSVDFYGTTHATSTNIALPNGSVIANGAIPNEFTIEFWAKTLASRGGSGGIFATGSSGIDVLLMQNASNGVYGFFSGNQSTIQPVLNTWIHVAYVRSVAGGFQKWLANGVQHDITANSTFSRTISSTLRKIGSDGGGDTFAGRLCDLRVWSVARTDAQILANKLKRLTGAEAGLSGYWKMNEGTGITVADSTAGAATGTFTNASTDILWAADGPGF